MLPVQKCLKDSWVLEQTRTARILTAITFHFNYDRFGFLAEVIRSLSEFPVDTLKVVIFTNAFRDEDMASLRRLCNEAMPNMDVSIRSCGDLPHPFDLTWCHKNMIVEEFAEKNDNGYTHFIYLEDDMRFSFANFYYFVKFREILLNFRLLPSFLRVEWNSVLGGFVNTDNPGPVNVFDQPHVVLNNELIFVNMPNPYNACFILDVDLAREYIRSHSFDHDDSFKISGWHVRERATQALCFENVPPLFRFRHVVPVFRQTSMAPGFAWVTHLPNNYANNQNVKFGKTRMDSLFIGMPHSVQKDIFVA
jgi:hypothetical protein